MPNSPKPTARRLAAAARLALTGALINTALAGLKITAGILGHSYALVADGIESTLDIFGSLIIWGGLQIAARPPDVSHPYGHGKAEPIAAIVVSFALIAAAIGIAIQSIREILTPHHAPAPYTLIVLVTVVIAKEFLFRKVIEVGEEISSTAVKTDAWHHRSDAITSAAAFVGILIALVGGPGYEAADDWAALLACGLIGWNGVHLLMPALHETMDMAPPNHVQDEVRAVAEKVPGVVAIDQCRMRKMGLDLFVDIHVEVNANLTVRDGHRIAHQVKDALREANPAIVDVLVHIEPDEE
ncbi:MAG: cation transporter [Verrucomicrobiaceae bacterium]|nr:MAG: cation transporter [Verrucomicrobiaceae bacterium]